MQRRSVLVLFAIGIGALVTAVTATAAYLADRGGAEAVSEALFWPNTLVQALMPAPNVGTSNHPQYEGTPLNLLAFFVSFPLAMCVYSCVAYLLLRRQKT